MLKPGKMSTFELLMRYLDIDESEKLFEAQARAYSLSILEPLKATNSLAFVDWNDLVGKVNDHIHFTEDTFTQPGTFFGTWIPRSSDSHFYAYAGILVANMKKDKNAPVSICAVLDDRKDSRTDKYEEEWNGFWHFFNVMQFAKRFAAVCYNGLDTHAYVALPYGQTATAAEDSAPSLARDEKWAEIREMLFDDEAVRVADTLESRGITAPDDAGYELANESGAVIAEMEMVWIHRNIGYMTNEQEADRGNAEAAGWRIFTTIDDIDTVFKEEG